MWPLERQQGTGISLAWPTDLIYMYDPWWNKFEFIRGFNKTNLKSVEQQMSPLECIFLTWPIDLVYDPRWSKFELAPDFIKANNLTYFQLNKQSLRPLECPQGFTLISPTDLAHDLRWPKFNHIRDFIKTNIPTNFQVNWATTVVSRAPTRFFFKFDLLTYLMTPGDFIKTNILTNFQVDWSLEGLQGISFIRSTDLVYDPRWPKFEFIKTNILTNAEVNWVRNVASRAPTIYYFNFSYWPSLRPKVTKIRTRPRFHQEKQSDQISGGLSKIFLPLESPQGKCRRRTMDDRWRTMDDG